MSKESDYIINQINQAPKDFRGDESDFIIDKINDQVNSEALGKYMRDSAYVWHNMMGGGTTGAFMKMLSGGLVDHYVENDKGFREFVNAQDPLDKMQIIKKYRN